MVTNYNSQFSVLIGDDAYKFTEWALDDLLEGLAGQGINPNELDVSTQLVYNIHNMKERRFDLALKGRKVISVSEFTKRHLKYSFCDHLDRKIAGTTWRFSNKALFDYFDRFNLNPEEIDADHIEYLEEALISELDEEYGRDVILDYAKPVVVGMKVESEPRGYSSKIYLPPTRIVHNSDIEDEEEREDEDVFLQDPDFLLINSNRL